MVRSIIEDQLGTLEDIRGNDLAYYVWQQIENSNFLKTHCVCLVLYIVPTMISWRSGLGRRSGHLINHNTHMQLTIVKTEDFLPPSCFFTTQILYKELKEHYMMLNVSAMSSWWERTWVLIIPLNHVVGIIFPVDMRRVSKDNNCSICWNSIHDAECVRLLPLCSHYFHLDCIDQWLPYQDTCPLCKGSTPHNTHGIS
jgi:hypothetical protein